MNKRMKCLAVVMIINLLLLAGCKFDTSSAFIFNEDWEGIINLGVYPDDYGPSKKELKDLIKRIELFLPQFEKNFSAGENHIAFTTQKPTPIEKISFISKEEINDNLFKISIDLPQLITASDYEGNPKGAGLFFDLYLPGKVVEANTLDYNNDYTMENIMKGEKKARINWLLSPHNLSTPTTLWVKFEPNK